MVEAEARFTRARTTHPWAHDAVAPGSFPEVADDPVGFRGTRCGMRPAVVDVLAEFPAEHDSGEAHTSRHKAPRPCNLYAGLCLDLLRCAHRDLW
jgi:hypothetical protein